MSNMIELLFLRRKLLMNKIKTNTDIPSYLKKVKYIYNDSINNECYINTQYNPNELTSLEIQVESLNQADDSLGVYCSPYGVRGYNDYRMFCYDNITNYEFSTHTGKYKTLSVRGGYNSNVGMTIINHSSKKYTVQYNSNLQTYTVSGISKWQSDLPLYLAAYNNANDVQKIYIGKIYYCIIYEGSNLVRNLIPVYNTRNNKAGLYDTVNGIEYYSLGKNDFKYA